MTVPTPAALDALIYEAVRFADWAAGEGIAPIDSEDAGDPSEFVMDYWFATADPNGDGSEGCLATKVCAEIEALRTRALAADTARASAETALAEARSALKPFAKAAGAPYMQYVQDNQRLFLETNAETVISEELRGADFRRARAALEKKP